MKYDFTTIMDRRGRDALALDMIGTGSMPGFLPEPPKEGFDIIPMWVADMNFPTAPSVTEAIIRRAQHPAFGYFEASDAYYQAIRWWQKERNQVEEIPREAIGYENGVLGGVISALRVFCSNGDKVLLHSPTYVGFTASLENNGFQIVHSPLVQDQDGIWRMDFDDMEKKLAGGKIHAAIFCSPHNPCGRVWEKWEIEQAMELYRRYGVYVISDEIWSDLLRKGQKHIPTQSVSEDAAQRTVALYAPSKTFNLAGLIGSYHIIYNTWIRDRIEKEAALSYYNTMNVLSMHALIGAYSPEGAEWVAQLCETLDGNVAYAHQFMLDHFEGVSCFKPEGTYMLFPDFTAWCEAHGKEIGEVLKAGWDVGVAWQDGRSFHGPCHIRMNLALPFSRVEEAMDRLKKYVFCV